MHKGKLHGSVYGACRGLAWWLLVLLVQVSSCSQIQDLDSTHGYRLYEEATYMVVAPKTVRPSQTVQISVTVKKMGVHPHITVHGTIRSSGEEYASCTDTFNNPATRLLQMQMPYSAPYGDYYLRVEGTTGNKLQGGKVFANETKLIFDVKQVSVFILFDRPFYRQGQKVQFRIIPVQPNLMPASDSMELYAMDATGTIVRRWNNMQANAGVLERSFILSDQPTYGEWKIRVQGFGHGYEKTFQVEEYYKPRLFLNVSMPDYIMDNSFALAGIITANHTSGRPARGNGTIYVEIRDPARSTNTSSNPRAWPRITKTINYFEGRQDFMFTLKELTERLGGLPTNKELYVTAAIFDWYLMQNTSGFAITVVHESVARVKLLGDKSRVFRPGFPITVYFAVVHGNGAALSGPRRLVTLTRIDRSVSGLTTVVEDRKIVRDDGIAAYKFSPRSDAQFLRLTARYEGSQVECLLYKAYSHHNHYLAIATTTAQPTVNNYMVFTIRSNIYVETVNYLIASGGNIIVANQLDMASKQKTFSVALSRDMAPSAHIVAYYLLNGEVMVDSLNFFINATRLNPVEMRVNMGKDFSKDTVEVNTFADPASYLSLYGQDYQLFRYGDSIFLTEDQIIDELESYDHVANKSYSAWFYQENQKSCRQYLTSTSYGVDANTTFAYAGLVVLTDANLTRIPHHCNESLGLLPCYDGSCYVAEQRCDHVMQCEDGGDEMGCSFKEESPFTPPQQRLQHVMRHYEQDTSWMWHSSYIKPYGRLDHQMPVPKEPMNWVMGGIAISREKGLGIVPDPIRHDATRPFYIQVEAPDSLSVGEQLGVRVAIFNYWDQLLECLVTLHGSDQYQFVAVEDMGQVSSYSPRTLTGDVQTMVYVRMRETATIHMPVLPVREVGNVTITISATSCMGRDTASRTIKIIPNGVTNYFNVPYLLDMISSGSQLIPSFDIPVEERFIVPEQRQHLYVPGSQRAALVLVGDVVGPGFFEPHLTTENMMHVPSGSAEQNLFEFAVNLFYLLYLRNTNELNATVRGTAIDYMNVALQRQLSYMDPVTGSFSMFRDYSTPKPSTWLTAAVLQYLQAAEVSEWRERFFIPARLLERSAHWLCQQQDPASGAFSDTHAPTYDRKMQPVELKEESGKTVRLDIPLTAHVLISLSEASSKKTISGKTRIDVETAKRRATSFLERYLLRLTDPYDIAIVAYALTAAKSSYRFEALNKLHSAKRTGEFTYWSADEIPMNPQRFVNTIPVQSSRLLQPNEARGVEATAYALMVYLQSNHLDDAMPIMKWLNTMRNSIGGFAGTRDSLVAIQALTSFALRDTDRTLYNLRLTLTSTSTPGWKKQVSLVSGVSWVTPQSLPIPNVFGEVRAFGEGHGMALLQLLTEVNVEYERLQKPKPNATYYDVHINRLQFSGRNGSTMEMHLCIRWVKVEWYASAGLTVLEVGLPTGFIIVNDVLRQYVQSGAVPSLGRATFKHTQVTFYFDSVPSANETCVQLRADRWWPVANVTIQHQIKVYDYFEPGIFHRTLYTTYRLFHLHICHVCGSFQCPYCPCYNGAPATLRMSPMATLAGMLLAAAWLTQTLTGDGDM